MNTPTIGAVLRARSFAEILDDVALAGDERDIRSPAQRLKGERVQDWLFSQFGANSAAEEPARRNFEAAFFADAEEVGEPIAPNFDMASFDMASFEMDEDKIAAELGLAAARSSADLAKARRSFALRNHPDLFQPALRAKANGRMQLANMLLDRRRREIEAKR
jgi:hypothetical protein